LAQTVRIIPQAPSIYFNTTLAAPINNLLSSDNKLEWDYIDSSANTNYYRYSENDNLVNNVQIDTIALTGAWTLLAKSYNSQCILMKRNSDNHFRVFELTSNGTSSSVTATIDIPTLLVS
jgi:hypothetical protein